MRPTVAIGNAIAMVAIVRVMTVTIARWLIHLRCHHLIKKHLHLLELLERCHLLLLLLLI